MPVRIVLGEVVLPDGLLVIIDPVFAQFWQGDAVPHDPESNARAHDLRLVGKDAEVAGRAYDREFDPLHLFDRRDPMDAQQDLAAFALARGLEANAEVLPTQMPHATRARLAAEAGNGIGVVKFNGLWGVAVDGLPRDRPLRVEGYAFDSDEWNGRWQYVDLVVDETAEVTSEQEVQGVMVDAGLLSFGDSPGLARHGASPGHHERLVAELRESKDDLVRVDAHLVAFGNRWGDGIFTISALRSADGRIARVRAKLGTPQVQQRMRHVWMRSLACIVTKKVLEEGHPVRFADRMEPHGPGDSGWFLSSGQEDDAYMEDSSNLMVVSVGDMVRRCKPFGRVILAEVGSEFTLVDGEFHPEPPP